MSSTSSASPASVALTSRASGCDTASGRRTFALRTADGAERDRATHERLVLADAKVGQHRCSDVARRGDQVGGTELADTGRSAHVVHGNYGLIDIGEER